MSLKGVDTSAVDLGVDWSQVELVPTPNPAYDISMLRFYTRNFRQRFQKPKLTKKERRKVGRGIRKRLRIEREMTAYFKDVIGTTPTSWQIDVMVSVIANGYEPMCLAFYRGGRGYGRTAVQTVIDAYMTKHRRHRDAYLSSAPVYRDYAEQGRLYQEFAERITRQKDSDAMDAMKYSYLSLTNDNWHYRFDDEAQMDDAALDEME